MAPLVKVQVTTPVQWELTLKTLLNKGLKKSYELGPGKVKYNQKTQFTFNRARTPFLLFED